MRSEGREVPSRSIVLPSILDSYASPAGVRKVIWYKPLTSDAIHNNNNASKWMHVLTVAITSVQRYSI